MTTDLTVCIVVDKEEENSEPQGAVDLMALRASHGSLKKWCEKETKDTIDQIVLVKSHADAAQVASMYKENFPCTVHTIDLDEVED